MRLKKGGRREEGGGRKAKGEREDRSEGWRRRVQESGGPGEEKWKVQA
jgi:hypothetical protein